MICALGPANVIHRDVRHDLLHGGELFQTRRPVLELLASLRGQQRLRVDRGLLLLLLDCLACQLMMLVRMLRVVKVGVMLVLLVLVLIWEVRVLLVLVVAEVRAVGGVSIAGYVARGRANMISAAASAPEVGSLICGRAIGRIVLLLGSGCRLRGRQLGLLLLLELGRQLDPETGVRTLGRRLMCVGRVLVA